MRLAQFSGWTIEGVGASIRNERFLQIKEPDVCFRKNQHELDFFSRKCYQIFEIRPVIYLLDVDRVKFAALHIKGDVFDAWMRYDTLLSMEYQCTWNEFVAELQRMLQPMRLR